MQRRRPPRQESGVRHTSKSKGATECSTNEGADFSTLRLYNGPSSPTITRHSRTATAHDSVGWVGGELAEGDARMQSKTA